MIEVGILVVGSRRTATGSQRLHEAWWHVVSSELDASWRSVMCTVDSPCVVASAKHRVLVVMTATLPIGVPRHQPHSITAVMGRHSSNKRFTLIVLGRPLRLLAGSL